MNISLFKQYENRYGKAFSAHIFNTYWAGTLTDASGMFNEHTDDYQTGSGWDVPQESASTSKLTGVVSYDNTIIDTENIIYAAGMFMGQSKMEGIQLDFPKLKDAQLMFAHCRSLKSVECDFSSLTGEGNTTANFLNNCSKLTTFKCNLSSLKSMDNMFSSCPYLTTFDCDLNSLESARNMCTTAKLTFESVKNIAEKIKTHENSDTTHNIDIGIALNTSSLYPYKWAETVNKIANKGWNVTVKLNGGSGEVLNASDYPDLTVTSYSIREKINSTENNKIEHTSSEGKDEVKTGFIMVSPDIDKKFNRIKLKTGAAHGGTKNVYIRVKDSNKQVIASSNITTVTTPSTEYEFIFDKSFTMIKNEKYYFEIFLEGESNRLNFSFRLAKPVEGSLAYGTLYEASPSSYKTRYSSGDDDYPGGDDGDDGEYNAWSKFYLEDEEKTVTTEQVDLDVFNSTVFEINGKALTNWSEESALILNLSPSNDNVSITNSYIFYLVDETGVIIDTEDELPVTLYFSNNDDTTTSVKIEKKKDTNGNYIEIESKKYSALIGISGNDNKVYYKNFSLVVN